MNLPSSGAITNYQRDGLLSFDNQHGAPNYYPNSFGGPENDPRAAQSTYYVTGDVARYEIILEHVILFTLILFKICTLL